VVGYFGLRPLQRPLAMSVGNMVMCGWVFWAAAVAAAPHMLDPHMPDPHMPDPHMPDPHMPDPHMLDPHMPDPHMPDPHMPDPHMLVPHMLDPHMLDPHMLDAAAAAGDVGLEHGLRKVCRSGAALLLVQNGHGVSWMGLSQTW
jgi:hypothetical protein